MAKKAAKAKTAKKAPAKKTAPPAKKAAAKKPAARAKKSPAKSKAAGDWRVATLARVRAIMKDAEPSIEEEVKWRKPSNNMQGVPVWHYAGIICTGETYKDYVKLTFAHGAALADRTRLFNASLDGNMRRAIDIHEDDKLDEKALKALIHAAMAKNAGKQKPKA